MSHVRSRDGTLIAFDRVGEGPAVVLVGGAFSYQGSPKMVELAELPADRFTVINYDRPSSGWLPRLQVEGEARAPLSASSRARVEPR